MMQLINFTQTENHFLKRTEITGSLSFEGSIPSRTELASFFMENFEAISESSTCYLKPLRTLFGSNVLRFTLNIYNDSTSHILLEKIQRQKLVFN